jgi:hypothetical protein
MKLYGPNARAAKADGRRRMIEEVEVGRVFDGNVDHR